MCARARFFFVVHRKLIEQLILEKLCIYLFEQSIEFGDETGVFLLVPLRLTPLTVAAVAVALVFDIQCTHTHADC